MVQGVTYLRLMTALQVELCRCMGWTASARCCNRRETQVFWSASRLGWWERLKLERLLQRRQRWRHNLGTQYHGATSKWMKPILSAKMSVLYAVMNVLGNEWKRWWWMWCKSHRRDTHNLHWPSPALFLYAWQIFLPMSIALTHVKDLDHQTLLDSGNQCYAQLLAELKMLW